MGSLPRREVETQPHRWLDYIFVSEGTNSSTTQNMKNISLRHVNQGLGVLRGK